MTNSVQPTEQNENLRKVIEALRAERQRFNDVLNMIPAYVVLLTPDYHVPFANRFFEERFGKSNGKRCYEYLFHRSEPCEVCETYSVLKTHSPHHWEWTGPDNHNYDIFDFPFTDTDGSPLIMEMGVDITVQKKAQRELKNHRDNLEVVVAERTRELRENEERLRSLYTSMTEGLATHEIVYENGHAVDYIITDVNPAFVTITGIAREAAVGKRASKLYGMGSAPYLDVYARVAAEGAPEDFETFFPPMDRHFAISAFPIGKGKFATVFLDITERRQIEQALRRSEEKYRMLFQNMAEGFALYELIDDDQGRPADWRILEVNDAYTRHTGLRREQVVGQCVGDLFPEAVVEYLPRFADVVASQTAADFETYAKAVNRYQHVVTFPAGGRRFASIIEDITERKRAEGQLARLASFPEKNPNPVLELDYEGKVTYLNPKARELFPDISVAGFSHLFLAGIEQLAQNVQQGDASTALTREVEVGGTYYHQTILNIPESQRIRLYGIDVTAGKKAEQALRDAAVQQQSAQYARNLIEVSLDPLVTISPEGKITDVNEATVKATGIAPEDLLGTAFSSYFTEPDLAEQGYRRVLAEGYVTDYPLTIRARDGRLMDVLYNASLYRDSEGKVQGVFAAARDVTAQKQASRYARSLIEASIDPLVTISSEGRITDVNEATVRATGVPREALVGTHFSDYFTEPEKAERGYREVFAKGFVTDYPLTIRHRNGHQMDVLYNAILYKDSHDKVLGVFAAARDVTLQKKAEAELRLHQENLEALVRDRTAELERLNTELARSNENLQQFAYASSHDLQEPLRVMSSFSQLLEKRYKGRLDADADEFIGYIVGSAARMQNLITDLLAYSRAGHKDANKTSVDCTEMAHRVVESMAATIAAAGGKVAIEPLPTIVAHQASIAQLFQNLISNAVKFRGVNPPRVHISARKADAEWVFSVRDNGIGIEPEYFQRIFQIFQRLHTREEYSGTGIGLSICKKIVENLGGRIWVESEIGKGSTFSFTIPVGKK